MMACTDRVTAAQTPVVQPPPPPQVPQAPAGAQEGRDSQSEDERCAAARHDTYARQLAHLPVWQHDDFSMGKTGKKIMSLRGQRDRLSRLAVRFRQLRRLLPGNLGYSSIDRVS